MFATAMPIDPCLRFWDSEKRFIYR